MELFISQLVNGVGASARLFLVAVGLVIIFGMLDVVNMAHGEFIMLGAYCACICVSKWHIPFAAALALSFAVTALTGMLLEQLLIRKLYGKVAETLLGTFALTYIFPEIIRLIFGPENQNMEVPIKGSLSFGKITIPYYNLFLIIMAFVVLAATLCLFFKTKFGMKLRSITQNREMSQCLGINSRQIDKITFAYGCGLGGLAGALVAPIASVTPDMGTEYVVDSFLVVILGGLNSIVGSFFGSAVIEESIAAMSTGMSLVTAKLLIFLIIIVIIRFKPQGLFAPKDRR
ncbi:MAG: urea ABC transporter permease subunit UrtB [Clostridium sp.]|nr:urea ABC transporter permease subunit UrtB [Clostridium sp.]